MKEITVTGHSLDEFAHKTSRALSGSELGKIISLKVESEILHLIFSRFGESRITLKVEHRESGFFAVKQKEHIAFAHYVFRDEIERKLCTLFEKLGASIVY
jgi:hypothetical protein